MLCIYIPPNPIDLAMQYSAPPVLPCQTARLDSAQQDISCHPILNTSYVGKYSNSTFRLNRKILLCNIQSPQCCYASTKTFDSAQWDGSYYAICNAWHAIMEVLTILHSVSPDRSCNSPFRVDTTIYRGTTPVIVGSLVFTEHLNTRWHNLTAFRRADSIGKQYSVSG